MTLLNEKNRNRLAFEESDAFNRLLRIRYKIEEKNGEMKMVHGLDRADSTGLVAMRIQSYFTGFVANAKRIAKLTAPPHTVLFQRLCGKHFSLSLSVLRV